MAGTNELLDGIVADLKTRFPELRTCSVHDGSLDPAEVARIGTRTPAMFVSCLGIPALENPGTGQADAAMELAIYIVTASTPQLPRGVAGRNLVDALLAYLPDARWGLAGIGEVSAIAAENHFTGDVDSTGVALWSVAWRQISRLGTDIWDSSGVMPTELYVGLEPNLGTEHISDYDLVS